MGAPLEVLIVGAGPTGLAMAAFLAAHGVRPRLVDRNLDRARESRALAIQPRTLEVLAGLGISGTLVELGNRNVTLRLHARGRAVTVPLFDAGLGDTPYPYLLFLSQAETERVLADHLGRAGIEVQRGVELTALRQQPDGVAATLRHGDGTVEQVSTGYVVGCDGAHSAVRQLSGIAFEGGSYPQTFVLADLEADGIGGGAAHVFLSRQGMLFFFPLVTPASWRLLAMRPRNDRTPPDRPVSLGEVQALADRATGGAVRLRDPVWMTNFRLHHRAARDYRVGRVFLAGDAAHIHSPAGAQGMNTGIQDAANLAWKLASTLAGADPAVLDTYQTERGPVGRAVLRATDRTFTIATTTNPLAGIARTRVAPALLAAGARAGRLSWTRGVRGRLFRGVAQLAIGYRRSPLSTDGPGALGRGPRGGDRLPDAPVTVDGRITTLHELIAAPGWHLLLRCELTGAEHLSGAAVHRLPAAPGQPEVVLVRPDGHIGYRGTAGDAAGLQSYLDRWLPHPS